MLAVAISASGSDAVVGGVVADDRSLDEGLETPAGDEVDVPDSGGLDSTGTGLDGEATFLNPPAPN